jgi:hypothetical protein
VITHILLAAILISSVVHSIVLTMYLRRKKPGPKPRKARLKYTATSMSAPADSMPAPRKRFRARDYPEIPMK